MEDKNKEKTLLLLLEKAEEEIKEKKADENKYREVIKDVLELSLEGKTLTLST